MNRLLNYTTQIAADKTVEEIRKILVKHGAYSVTTEYDPYAHPIAVCFRLHTRFGEDLYQVPARIARVTKVLQQLHRAGKIPPRLASPEQAARVGWRIAKDWIEASLALVDAGVVDFEEAFLAHQLGQDNVTFYQHVQAKRQALPGPA